MRKITKFLLSLLLVVVVIGGGLGTGLYIYLNQEEPVVLDEKPTILMPDEIDVYHKSNFQLKPVLIDKFGNIIETSFTYDSSNYTKVMVSKTTGIVTVTGDPNENATNEEAITITVSADAYGVSKVIKVNIIRDLIGVYDIKLDTENKNTYVISTLPRDIDMAKYLSYTITDTEGNLITDSKSSTKIGEVLEISTNGNKITFAPVGLGKGKINFTIVNEAENVYYEQSLSVDIALDDAYLTQDIIRNEGKSLLTKTELNNISKIVIKDDYEDANRQNVNFAGVNKQTFGNLTTIIFDTDKLFKIENGNLSDYYYRVRIQNLVDDELLLSYYNDGDWKKHSQNIIPFMNDDYNSVYYIKHYVDNEIYTNSGSFKYDGFNDYEKEHHISCGLLDSTSYNDLISNDEYNKVTGYKITNYYYNQNNTDNDFSYNFDISKLTEGIHIYANYDPITITLTLINPNSETVQNTVTFDGEFGASLEELSKTGYVFAGYTDLWVDYEKNSVEYGYSRVDGEIKIYEPTTICKFHTDTILFAVFYTNVQLVSYFDEVIDPIKVYYGEDLLLPSGKTISQNIDTKGYEFNGWYSVRFGNQKDSNYEVIADTLEVNSNNYLVKGYKGAGYVRNNQIEIYAKWVKDIELEYFYDDLYKNNKSVPENWNEKVNVTFGLSLKDIDKALADNSNLDNWTLTSWTANNNIKYEVDPVTENYINDYVFNKDNVFDKITANFETTIYFEYGHQYIGSKQLSQKYQFNSKLYYYDNVGYAATKNVLGYTFNGWKYTVDKDVETKWSQENINDYVVLDKHYYGNVILNAYYTENEYNISYYTENGIKLVDHKYKLDTLKLSNQVSKAPYEVNYISLNKTGYTLVDWEYSIPNTNQKYLKSELEGNNQLGSKILSDLVARPVYEANIYDITFKTVLGEYLILNDSNQYEFVKNPDPSKLVIVNIEYDSAKYTGEANVLTDRLTKDGYVLEDWYYDADYNKIFNFDMYNSSTPGNFVLYAKLTSSINLYYSYTENDGDLVDINANSVSFTTKNIVYGEILDYESLFNIGLKDDFGKWEIVKWYVDLRTEEVLDKDIFNNPVDASIVPALQDYYAIWSRNISIENFGLVDYPDLAKLEDSYSVTYNNSNDLLDTLNKYLGKKPLGTDWTLKIWELNNNYGLPSSGNELFNDTSISSVRAVFEREIDLINDVLYVDYDGSKLERINPSSINHQITITLNEKIKDVLFEEDYHQNIIDYGYDFVGWYNPKDGMIYAESQLLDEKIDTNFVSELYALYKPIVYNITYYNASNDDLGLTGYSYTVEGINITEPTTEEKIGYIKTWNYFEDTNFENGITYQELSNKLVIDEDITNNVITYLYAKPVYEIIKYKVHYYYFYSSDGPLLDENLNPVIKEYTVENYDFVVPSIPNQSGYIDGEWRYYINSAFSGDYYLYDEIEENGLYTDLYVKPEYTLVEYKVTFKFMNETKETYVYDDLHRTISGIISYNELNSPGFIFTGWDTGGKAVIDGNTITINKDVFDEVFVYATYEYVDYSLKYFVKYSDLNEAPTQLKEGDELGQYNQVVRTYNIGTNFETFEHPTVLEKVGYEISYKYYDSSDINFENEIKNVGEKTHQDLLVVVHYQLIEYQMKFIDGDGTVHIHTYTVNNNTTSKVYPEAKTIEGYNFAGWYVDDTSWADYVLTYGDLEIEAQYVLVDYTINYYDGLNLIHSVSYNVESLAEVYDVPSKNGKIGYWLYKDTDGNILSEITLGNINAYAIYENITYTLDFIKDGAIVDYELFNVDTDLSELAVPCDGQWVVYNLHTLDKVGEITNLSSGYYCDLTVVYEDGSELTIYVVDGRAYFDSQTAEEHIVLDDGMKVNWKANVFSSYTIYIPEVVKATYSITYVDSNGAMVGTGNYQIGEILTIEPELPTKDGYVAIGWDYSNLSTGDVVVQAIYEPVNYKISFVDEEDNLIKEVEYNVLSNGFEISGLDKEHYNYSIIYNDGSITYEDIVLGNVTGDVTATVKYDPIEYSIEFVGIDYSITYTVLDLDFEEPIEGLYDKDGYNVYWSYQDAAGNIGKKDLIGVTLFGDLVATVTEEVAIYKVIFFNNLPSGISKEDVFNFTLDEINSYSVVGSFSIVSPIVEISVPNGYNDWEYYTKDGQQVEFACEDLYAFAVLLDDYIEINYSKDFTYSGKDEVRYVTSDTLVKDIKAPQIKKINGYISTWEYFYLVGVTKHYLSENDVVNPNMEVELKNVAIEYTITFSDYFGNVFDTLIYTCEDRSAFEKYSLTEGPYVQEGLNTIITFYDESNRPIVNTNTVYANVFAKISYKAVSQELIYHVDETNTVVSTYYLGITEEKLYSTAPTPSPKDNYVGKWDYSELLYTAEQMYPVYNDGSWIVPEVISGTCHVYPMYLPTEYTVKFEDELGNLLGTDTYTIKDNTITHPEVEQKEGYDYKWIYYNELEGQCVNNITVGNIVATLVYTPIVYSVTFYDYNDDVISETTYTVDNKNIIYPVIPNRDGYVSKWDVVTLTTGDVSVYVTYTPIPYEINFYRESLLLGKFVYTLEDKTFEVPEFVNVKKGYSYKFVDESGKEFSKYTLPTSNCNYYQKETINEYTVTFEAYDGIVDSFIYTVNDLDSIKNNIPQIPYREGYDAVWKVGNKLWTDYVVTENNLANILVVAEYSVESYKIVYLTESLDADGNLIYNSDGSISYVEYTVINYTKEDTLDSLELPTPAYNSYNQTYYTKISWMSFELTYSKDDIYVYPSYSNPKSFYITFYDGESLTNKGNVISVQEINVENRHFEEPSQIVAEWVYYDLLGNEVEDVNKSKLQNLTAIKSNKKAIVVDYLDHEENVIASKNISVGTVIANIISPEIPEKIGYSSSWLYMIFDTDTNNYVLVDSALKVKEDMILIAKLAEYTAIQYTITYKDKLGNVIESGTYTYQNLESSIKEVPDETGFLVEDGYSKSWTIYDMNGILVKNLTNVTGELVAVATYNPIEYTITYYNEVGAEIAGRRFTVLNPNFSEPTPIIMSGYESTWEYSVDGVVISRQDILAGNIKSNVTAKPSYSVIEFNIKYYLNGQEIKNVVYKVGELSLDVEPEIKEISGYKASWKYTNESLETVIVDETTVTSVTGNLTAEVNYELINYVVEFYDKDKTLISSTTYNINNMVIDEPQIPDLVALGYKDGKFKYYLNDELVVDLSNVLGDLKAYATYEAIEYNINFYDSSNNIIDTVIYTVDNKVFIEPIIDGFIWKYYYEGTNTEVVLSDSSTLGNLDARATAPDPNSYIITFVNIDGVVVAKRTVLENTAIDLAILPDVPERVGYENGKWNISEGQIINSDLTIEPIYTAITYYITFYNEDGTEVVDEVEYTIGTKLSEITLPEVPQKHGYSGTWQIQELTYGDVDVYPKYTISTYNIYYHTFTRDLYDQKTYTISYILDPVEIPSVDGRTSIVWKYYTTSDFAGTDYTWDEVKANDLVGDLYALADYEVIVYNVYFYDDNNNLYSELNDTYHVDNIKTQLPNFEAKEILGDQYKLFAGWKYYLNGIEISKESIGISEFGDIDVVAQYYYINRSISNGNIILVSDNVQYSNVFEFEVNSNEYYYIKSITVDGKNVTVPANCQTGTFTAALPNIANDSTIDIVVNIIYEVYKVKITSKVYNYIDNNMAQKSTNMVVIDGHASTLEGDKSLSFTVSVTQYFKDHYISKIINGKDEEYGTNGYKITANKGLINGDVIEVEVAADLEVYNISYNSSIFEFNSTVSTNSSNGATKTESGSMPMVTFDNTNVTQITALSALTITLKPNTYFKNPKVSVNAGDATLIAVENKENSAKYTLYAIGTTNLEDGATITLTGTATQKSYGFSDKTDEYSEYSISSHKTSTIPWGDLVTLYVSGEKDLDDLYIYYDDENNNRHVIMDFDDGGIYDSSSKTVSFYMPHYTVCVDAKSSCFVAGTKILMGDGTYKNVEDIKPGDMIMTWNFFEGKYEAQPVALYWAHEESNVNVITLNFSNGNTIEIVNSHGFYHKESGEFVQINSRNYSEYIGHEFVSINLDGTYESTTLVSATSESRRIMAYSLLSAFNCNAIAYDMLTITYEDYEGIYSLKFDVDENMTFTQESIDYYVDLYGLYTYEEWSEYMSIEEFYALNGQYYKILVGRGFLTEEDIYKLLAGLKEI